MTIMVSLFAMVRRFVVRWQSVLAGLGLVLLVLVGVRLWPHPPLKGWKPSSVAVYDDRGKLLRLVLASDERYRLWVYVAAAGGRGAAPRRQLVLVASRL